MLATLILAVHLLIIAFNLFGLIAIPLGARLGWRFVHAPVWRLLHIASWAAVALQAMLGRACFLTIWQDEATGRIAGQPLIVHWVNALVYWPLPLWVFAALYIAAFCYVLALLWIVPIRWRSER